MQCFYMLLFIIVDQFSVYKYKYIIIYYELLKLITMTSPPIYCNVCNISFDCPAKMHTHVKTKKHIENEKRYECGLQNNDSRIKNGHLFRPLVAYILYIYLNFLV